MPAFATAQLAAQLGICSAEENMLVMKLAVPSEDVNCFCCTWSQLSRITMSGMDWDEELTVDGVFWCSSLYTSEVVAVGWWSTPALPLATVDHDDTPLEELSPVGLRGSTVKTVG